MCQASPPHPVVVNVPGPGRALDVHDDPRHRLLQLHHDDGAEVAALVPVGVEVSWEPSEGCVANLG